MTKGEFEALWRQAEAINLAAFAGAVRTKDPRRIGEAMNALGKMFQTGEVIERTMARRYADLTDAEAESAAFSYPWNEGVVFEDDDEGAAPLGPQRPPVLFRAHGIDMVPDDAWGEE